MKQGFVRMTAVSRALLSDLQGGHDYPHFTDDDAVTQAGEVTDLTGVS